MIKNVHKFYNKFNGVQIIFVAMVKRNIETIFSPTNIATTSHLNSNSSFRNYDFFSKNQLDIIEYYKYPYYIYVRNIKS